MKRRCATWSARAQAARTPMASRCRWPTTRNAKPRVGLIWRTPWQPRIETLTDFPPGCAVTVPERGNYTHYSRPLLLARVAWGPGGATLTLLNVHLKSRRPEFVAGEKARPTRSPKRGRSCERWVMRAAEAAALRRLVIDLTPAGSMLLLGGDFNDEPEWQ